MVNGNQQMKPNSSPNQVQNPGFSPVGQTGPGIVTNAEPISSIRSSINIDPSYFTRLNSNRTRQSTRERNLTPYFYTHSFRNQSICPLPNAPGPILPAINVPMRPSQWQMYPMHSAHSGVRPPYPPGVRQPCPPGVRQPCPPGVRQPCPPGVRQSCPPVSTISPSAPDAHPIIPTTTPIQVPGLPLTVNNESRPGFPKPKRGNDLPPDREPKTRRIGHPMMGEASGSFLSAVRLPPSTSRDTSVLPMRPVSSNQICEDCFNQFPFSPRSRGSFSRTCRYLGCTVCNFCQVYIHRPACSHSEISQTSRDAQITSMSSLHNSLPTNRLELLEARRAAYSAWYMNELETNVGYIGIDMMQPLTRFYAQTELVRHGLDLARSFDFDPIGASIEEIDRFSMQYKYVKMNPTNDMANSENDRCVICLMDFEADDDIRFLCCTHIFHVKCIDRWLVYNKKCPVCRLSIDKEK